MLALLEANDVALAASPALAAGHLKIGKQVKNRRVISVDSRGRAREYELNYSVYYTIKSAHIDAENVVKLQRELLFDPDNVLGADYEEQTLYRDMKRDAARLILQQLEHQPGRSRCRTNPSSRNPRQHQQRRPLINSHAFLCSFVPISSNMHWQNH